MPKTAYEEFDGQVDLISDHRRALEEDLIAKSPIYGRMVEQISETYGEGQQDGGLDQTTRILLALGMAVHSGSKSSVEWTVTRAINHGASPQQIQDTIDIALLNGGTFAVAAARFAHQAAETRFRRPRHS